MSSASPPVVPDDQGVATATDPDEQPATTARLTVEEPIPCPAKSEMRSAHIFGLLGLTIAYDRRPVHQAVKRVWAGWKFRTDKRSWGEVPHEDRIQLEDQLRKELETAFPDNMEVAEKIRRSNLWLPWWLLTEKHRLRKKEQ